MFVNSFHNWDILISDYGSYLEQSAVASRIDLERKSEKFGLSDEFGATPTRYGEKAYVLDEPNLSWQWIYTACANHSENVNFSPDIWRRFYFNDNREFYFRVWCVNTPNSQFYKEDWRYGLVSCKLGFYHVTFFGTFNFVQIVTLYLTIVS